MNIEPNNQLTSAYTSLLRWLPLLILTAIVSVLFLDVARPFLAALIMAAIVSEIAKPIYRFMMKTLYNNNVLSAASTLIIIVASIIIPLIGVAILAANQATSLTLGAVAIYGNISANPVPFELPDWLPFQDEMEDAWPQILAKVQELVGIVAAYLATALAALTKGTASFFLNLFIFLYAMYFFVQMERSIISQVLSFTTLPASLQEKLDERIISVSRATIKGTLFIAVIQGALGGIGFWVAGVQAPIFWAVIVTIASVIPAVGGAIIVLGGAVYLAINGAYPMAIALALWGSVVVGTIDNILRPILVGREAQIHDIFILIGTLGGLAAFGAVGLVLGPVLAGLFLTVWKTIRDMAEESHSQALSPNQENDRV